MEQERECLLIKAAQASDQAAMAELLQAHTALIHMLARRFHTSADMREELVQAGCVGLIEAIKRFKDEKQTRLSTYAVPWIIGEMKRTLRAAESQRICVSFDTAHAEGGEVPAERIPGVSFISANMLDLKLALEQLDQKDQMIICLRYFRDKTQKETALLLNRSQSQISKAENRLLNWLREQLA